MSDLETKSMQLEKKQTELASNFLICLLYNLLLSLIYFLNINQNIYLDI